MTLAMMRPASEKGRSVPLRWLSPAVLTRCPVLSAISAPVTATSVWDKLPIAALDFPQSAQRCLCLFPFRTQDVPMSAHCVNQLHGIIAIDLSPKSGNINLNDVAEFFPVVVVEVFQQLTLGHDCARPMNEILQNTVLHRHQRNLLLPASHRTLNSIELKIGYREDRGSLALSAADQGLGSRQKFAQIKGLGYVIVRARIEQPHDIVFLVTGRQHEDGRRVALFAISLQ